MRILLWLRKQVMLCMTIYKLSFYNGFERIIFADNTLFL